MKLILKIIAGLVGLVVVLVAALAITVMVTLKPNIPAETYMPQPAADQAEQHVLIFGATGKLGQEIAADLIAGGDRVTAFVRETSDRSELEPLGVSFVVGDVMDRQYRCGGFLGRRLRCGDRIALRVGARRASIIRAMSTCSTQRPTRRRAGYICQHDRRRRQPRCGAAIVPAGAVRDYARQDACRGVTAPVRHELHDTQAGRFAPGCGANRRRHTQRRSQHHGVYQAA